MNLIKGEVKREVIHQTEQLFLKSFCASHWCENVLRFWVPNKFFMTHQIIWVKLVWYLWGRVEGNLTDVFYIQYISLWIRFRTSRLTRLIQSLSIHYKTFSDLWNLFSICRKATGSMPTLLEHSPSAEATKTNKYSLPHLYKKSICLRQKSLKSFKSCPFDVCKTHIRAAHVKRQIYSMCVCTCIETV